MEQCKRMVNKQSGGGPNGMLPSYGQCSRKASVGSLCTQHEQVRLTNIRIEERTARMKARWSVGRSHFTAS